MRERMRVFYNGSLESPAYTPVPENMLENRSWVANPAGIHARDYAAVWIVGIELSGLRTAAENGNIWRINTS